MKRLLLLVLLCACSKPVRPPVILISIDTLRADHLPVYGYRAIRTPAIDSLAVHSTVYREAWSHCPLTLPSHLSMLTGLLPPEHGVRDNAGYHFDGAAHPTIASLLRSAGYHTGAAVSAYVLRGTTGSSSGFEEFDDAIGIVDGAPLGSLQRPGAVTEKIAERWIDAHAQEPFFYFLHIYEPHAPYHPSYDADVVAADSVVGSLLDHLRKSGVYERALIILVSDHGEGLMDHGEQEHGVFLYREDLHVPLLIKRPGSRHASTSSALTGLIDVAPTILDATGVKAPAGMTGVSLLKDSDRGNRMLYAESLFPRIHLGWSELRAMVRGPMHVIDAPEPEVYDMTRDAGEHHNLVVTERRTYNELKERARTTAGSFQAPQRIAPEEAKKLAALGYVSAGDESAGGPLPDPKRVIGQLERLREVEALRQRGDHGQAAVLLRALLSANSRWSDVRDQLGAELDAAGDHLAAAQVYEEGIRVTPRLAGSFALSAGTALLSAGDVASARAHAELALSSGEAAAHLLLGEIALRQHDLDGAGREAAVAEKDAAQRVHALFLSARVAADRHDYPLALTLLNQVEQTRRTTGASLPEHFHYVAADALARTNRMEEGAREFERELSTDPGNLRAYADLALLELIANQHAEARITLERLAARHPGKEICLDIARQLDEFGEKEQGGIWRRRGRVQR